MKHMKWILFTSLKRDMEN